MSQDVILRVIEKIYEAATTGTGWNDLLNEIADIAHADNGWLVVAMPEHDMNTVIAPRADPDIIANYQRYWWMKDVTLQATFTAPVGRITSLGEIGRARFLSSEFYNDFWRRSGQAADRIVSNLVVGRNAMASIGLQPSRLNDQIDTEMAKTFAVLVPHLIRSVQIRCAMRKLELERDIARATPRTGVVLIDKDMRILLADPKAETIIEESPYVRYEQGRFVLGGMQDSVRLQRLVLSCDWQAGNRVKGGRVFCPCGEDAPGLRIDVLPFNDRTPIVGPERVKYSDPLAILVLADLTRHRQQCQEQLRRKFDLTPAEAMVALELVRGDSRANVAGRLGVTLATVRTHMMHIFEKIGVHSRSALIHEITQSGLELELLES